MSDSDDESHSYHAARENISDIDMEDPEGPQFQALDYISIPTLRELGWHQSDYESFLEERGVQRLLREVARDDGLWYKTVFIDGHTELVPFEQLLSLSGGPEALEALGTDLSAAQRIVHSRKSTPSEQTSETGSVQLIKKPTFPPSDREIRRRRITSLAQNRKAAQQSTSPSGDELASPDKTGSTRRTRSQPIKKASMLPYRGQSGTPVMYDSDDDLVVSDLVPTSKKRRAPVSARAGSRTRAQKRRQYISGSEFSEEETTRRSGRVTGKRGVYTEPGIDDDFMDIENSQPKPTRPRVVHSKEIFPPLDEGTRFVKYHNSYCETCSYSGYSRHRGHLVYCQGCSYAYHTECIGSRTTREHLVTKTAEDDFVLQCKRCIGIPRRKDSSAPYTQNCQECRESGKACAPFRALGSGKKKPGSADGSAAGTPDVEVDADLLYNPDHVLFRCIDCRRGWHWEHLPSRDEEGGKATAEQRREEYSEDFRCIECLTHTLKIQTIRAWRPASSASSSSVEIDDYNEDDREYLIKFTGLSYFRSEWLPGAWVWGTNSQMRSHFVKKNPMFALTTEEAVPESMLRVEIVYDVRYTSIVPTGEDRAVDVARIGEVAEAYVKWQGGEGGDVVWEVPPQEPKKSKKGKGKQKARVIGLDSGEEGKDTEEEDVDEEENARGRWEDWKKAYEDFVHGNFVHLPKNTLKRRDMVREKAFKGLEKKEQPSYIVGGTLMKYQMDGMNWLYYKWHQGQTSILADEMGLGKTIQIISYLSIMVNDLSLYPFLIVVPHSTVPNWKREIQNWVPSMRVVAYFGSSESRALSRKYELFHSGTRNLKCHIVVTSYTTPVSDSQYLKGIPWEALIVDEGQRLKNDESLLYKSLEGYKIKHKVLMTGTPLQNNPRELFNLLHFLDPSMDAEELEKEFGELTKENVKRLHDMIRPFFLRRTKKEVLTFLPPMAEVIVPVTMSSLQRKLYKSILAQDPVLIKSIFRNPGDKSRAGNLKNVLMQLRKVLGHPFFYSDDIEDRAFDQETLHRNLIEAGSKFELLNIMLPKLKERGHRVLMFSQFLGMLDVMEDFLAGLGMSYQRLDGGTNTQEKQRRIDAYNRPGSTDFAFLLSTRAGGVGINLATADTVIILDPDFNPHQDIQALSRAHRIGQKNKVLVFHLVTRDTAEEKIMQIGKKKLSLDHLIIEKMGAEGDDEEQVDVESVLKFGARALFEDEGVLEERRIKYDSDGVDRLLDRSTIEETKTTEVAGVENAFSFARVWANDKGALEEGGLGDDASEGDMDIGFWDKLLAEREEQARMAAAAAAQELGRGKRRKKVDYSLPNDEFQESSPKKPNGNVGSVPSDDEEFRAEEDPETESDDEMAVDMGDGLDGLDLQQRIAKYQDRVLTKHDTSAPAYQQGQVVPVAPLVTLPHQGTFMTHGYSVAPVAPMAPMAPMAPISAPPQYLPQQLPRSKKAKGSEGHVPKQVEVILAENAARVTPKCRTCLKRHDLGRCKIKKPEDRVFKRVEIIPVENIPGETRKCRACLKRHALGQCKLKKMGVEYCPLCGIAHYGRSTACAHMQNEGSLTAMIQALKQSKEDPQLVKEAKAYIVGRKGGVKRRSTGGA